MPRAKTPDALRGRPFTRTQALAAGITPKQLEGPAYRSIFRGVFVEASLPDTTHLRAQAALLKAPDDAVASHVTALEAWGLVLPGEHDIHVSTNEAWVTRLRGIRGHRRQEAISRRTRGGLAVTGPDRTIVDLGTMISLVWLIVAAEHMFNRRYSDLETLKSYARERHLSGVRILREALHWIRAGAESPMETLTRLLLVFCHLPEPEIQAEVCNAFGQFVARVDLGYRRWKVAVEYVGQWHEHSAEQRARDRNRREALVALGWIVIEIYDKDLGQPETIPLRVVEALRLQGWVGPDPRPSELWKFHIAGGNLWSVYPV